MSERTLTKLRELDVIVADHWKLHVTRAADEETEEITGFVPKGDWLGSTWWEDGGVEANASLEARPSVPEVEAAVTTALGFSVDFLGLKEDEKGMHLEFGREALSPEPKPVAVKPAPSDRALKAIQAKRREVSLLNRKALADKASYKASKAQWELGRDELEELIRQSEVEENLPLVQRMEQPAPSANGEDKVTAHDDSWKQVELSELGIQQRFLAAMTKQGILTVGELCEFTTKQGEYRKVDGIGPAGWTQIDDALVSFWAKRKEQGLSTPDTPAGVVQEVADATELPEGEDQDEEAE